ncbi:TolC family protein [Williamwhitmania taraxaci]|nr:TolC family protein [Williamwhitmania taraxaci]
MNSLISKITTSVMIIKPALTTLFVGITLGVWAQAPMVKTAYTLDDIIQLAKDQSPDAFRAKHTFRASYWEYRTYKADLLPSLSLDATIPEFNRSLKKYQLSDGTYSYIEENSSSASANLSMKQNIGLTGGNLFVTSEMMRTDQLGSNKSTTFFASPFVIGFSQPINGYNSFRWKKKIQPLKYEEARRRYLQDMENVSMKAANLFFSLLISQQQLEVAQINSANSDTLYKISRGRYNIGTIAENELLQMELSNLNAGKALNEARIQLEVEKFRIRSFLGFNDKVDIELSIPGAPPSGELAYEDVMSKVGTNNPDLLSYDRELLESQERVALARSQRGFQANLYARYGVTQQAAILRDAYKDPQEQQRVSLGIQIPILDWGLGRGKVQMAKSNLELARIRVQQARVDFNQQLFLQVMQFNMEDDQLYIATKADTIAQKRYEVTKQRFLIGKITVLDLNIAQNERDAAKISYLNALSTYWGSYFNLQSIALFDFARNKELETDFETLVK